MVERLIAGELDAIITDISDTRLFETLGDHPKVGRLFPDYVGEDQKLYRETGIYTPVHMIVMSRKLDRQRPDLAAKFYTAFEQAKQIAYDDILSDRGGFSVVYLREKLKEQIAAWDDPGNTASRRINRPSTPLSSTMSSKAWSVAIVLR